MEPKERVAAPHSASSFVVRNITSNWAVLAVNTVISLLLAPIVVNKLGSVYYGLWTLLMQLTGYLYLFDFGVRDSVVKYVAQYHASGERDKLQVTVRTAIWLYSLVSLAVLAMVSGIVIALPHIFNIPPDAVLTARVAAFVAGASVAQSFLANVYVGVLMGLHRLYRVSQASIYYAVARFVGTYVLLINGYGLIALSLLHFALSFANAIYVARLCRVYLPGVPVRPGRPMRADVMKLLNYGKYVLFSNIGDKVVFASDAIVVAMFLPIAALTPYAIAGTLVENMRSVVRAMAGVLNPLTSSLQASGDEKSLHRVLFTGAKGALLVGLPICIGFITLGRTFVSMWIGEAHATTAGNVMSILAMGYIVGMPYNTIVGMLTGLAAHRILATLRIIEGAINLTLSVILVKVIGLEGVALGTAIPHMIVVGWVLPRALPKIFPFDLRAYYLSVYGRTLLAAVPFVVACWLVRTVVQPTNLPSFFLWGFLCLLAYIAPAWSVALTAEERALAMRTIGRRRGALTA